MTVQTEQLHDDGVDALPEPVLRLLSSPASDYEGLRLPAQTQVITSIDAPDVFAEYNQTNLARWRKLGGVWPSERTASAWMPALASVQSQSTLASAPALERQVVEPVLGNLKSLRRALMPREAGFNVADLLGFDHIQRVEMAATLDAEFALGVQGFVEGLPKPLKLNGEYRRLVEQTTTLRVIELCSVGRRVHVIFATAGILSLSARQAPAWGEAGDSLIALVRKLYMQWRATHPAKVHFLIFSIVSAGGWNTAARAGAAARERVLLVGPRAADPLGERSEFDIRWPPAHERTLAMRDLLDASTPVTEEMRFLRVKRAVDHRIAHAEQSIGTLCIKERTGLRRSVIERMFYRLQDQEKYELRTFRDELLISAPGTTPTNLEPRRHLIDSLTGRWVMSSLLAAGSQLGNLLQNIGQQHWDWNMLNARSVALAIFFALFGIPLSYIVRGWYSRQVADD